METFQITNIVKKIIKIYNLQNKIYNNNNFNNKWKFDEIIKSELSLKEIDNKFKENNNNLDYLNRKLENNFNIKNNLSEQFDKNLFKQNFFN